MLMGAWSVEEVAVFLLWVEEVGALLEVEVEVEFEL